MLQALCTPPRSGNVIQWFAWFKCWLRKILASAGLVLQQQKLVDRSADNSSAIFKSPGCCSYVCQLDDPILMSNWMDLLLHGLPPEPGPSVLDSDFLRGPTRPTREKMMHLWICSKIKQSHLVGTRAQLMKRVIKWRYHKWCSGVRHILRCNLLVERNKISSWPDGNSNTMKISWDIVWGCPNEKFVKVVNVVTFFERQ